MKQNKTSKRAVLTSALSLLLCCTMLIGTTWAWFTDSVTSAGNIIKSGTLDVEMKWAEGNEDPDNTAWTDASTGAIFNNDLWEPGYVEVKHVKIANVGTLAFKYQIVIKANGELTKTADGKTLADAIDVYYLENATQVADRADLANIPTKGTLAQFLENNATANNTATGKLYPKDNTDSLPDNHTVTIALKMRESAGNEYQDMAIGTDFSVQLLATQWTYEEDTFDDQYDALADETPDNAGWPVSTSNVTVTDPTKPTTVSVGSGEGAATVTIPEDPDNAGKTFALTVAEVPVDPVANPGETTYDITFTKDGEEVKDGDIVYTVTLNVGFVDLTEFNHNGVALTKVDNLDDLAENKYYYDEDTGIVTFMTKGFSPFTAKYLFSGGNGKEAHPYLIKTYADWKSLSEKSVSTSGVATQGRYFDVLTDLDFTDKTSGKETLRYFNGDLDFNGHSVKGITDANSYKYNYGGLIYKTTGDATISNLDYYVTSPKTDETNKIVLQASENKTLTFKNVNTFGLANLSDNNTGIYLYMSNNAAAVNFYDCTNNATLVNSNGYTGVFVGRGDKCPSYVFDNCVNAGNISSLPSKQNTGVLISNLNNYGASVTITVNNCVNRGNIYYTAGTTDLVAGNYTPASVTINGEVTNEGTVSQVAYNALTVGSDNKFVTSAITGAKEYQLGFAFSDAENVSGGTISLSCKPTQEELANNAIFAYSWIGEKNLPDGAVTGTVTIGGTEFKTYNDNGTMYYVFSHNNGASRAFKTQPIVTLTAIGENDSVSLYTYKYA